MYVSCLVEIQGKGICFSGTGLSPVVWSSSLPRMPPGLSGLGSHITGMFSALLTDLDLLMMLRANYFFLSGNLPPLEKA